MRRPCRLQVMVSAEERTRFQELAKSERRALSSWLRLAVLGYLAGREAGGGDDHAAHA